MNDNKKLVLYEDGVKEENKGSHGIYHKPNLDIIDSNSEEFQDDILHCYECDEEYIGECSIHKSKWILNKRINCRSTLYKSHSIFDDYYNENIDISECFCKTNSIKHIKTTLPNGFFLIKSKVENTTYGIWTTNFINRGTILGPFLGNLTCDTLISSSLQNIIKDDTNDFIWSLLPSANVSGLNLVDARDCMTANYLRFVRRPTSENGHNILPIQFDGKIFYQAMKDISPSEELLVKYDVQTFRPAQCQDSITVRLMSFKDQIFPIAVEPSIEKFRNTSKIMELENSSEEGPVKRKSKLFVKHARNPLLYRPGAKAKVDDEIRKCLKEIFLKYPCITGVDANKKLRKLLPKKPLISDKTVLTVAHKYGYREVIGFNNDFGRAFRNPPKVQEPSTKVSSFEALERCKSSTIEKPTQSAEETTVTNKTSHIESEEMEKISDAMFEFMRQLLRSDPWMSVKDLNTELRAAFPQKHKVTDAYLNQMVSRKKLRPIKNARIKVDDEVTKYILQLHFGEGLQYNRICWKVNERFPDRSDVSDKFVARIIRKYSSE